MGGGRGAWKSTEAAPIKCDGRESVGRPTDSHIESAGRLTNSPPESVGKPADSLPAHYIGAASGHSRPIDKHKIRQTLPRNSKPKYDGCGVSGRCLSRCLPRIHLFLPSPSATRYGTFLEIEQQLAGEEGEGTPSLNQS